MPFCCCEHVDRETLDLVSLEKPAWRPCLPILRGVAAEVGRAAAVLVRGVAFSHDRLWCGDFQCPGSM